jgi:succinyl-CoA synthetase beta subunit
MKNPRVPGQGSLSQVRRRDDARQRRAQRRRGVDAAKKLGGSVWVVKAQIHAGGRGKGGGVKVAKSLDEVREKAKQILGMQLVTHQTGPQGRKCGAC